jgi:hypothetical protein
VRRQKDLGERRHARIEYQRSGFIIPAPDAPWIECFITDVSESGLCLEVGALVIPEIFAVVFTTCGTVRRICVLVWRNGKQIGARFVTAKELRKEAQLRESGPHLLSR